MTENFTHRAGYRFCLVNIECLPNSSNFNVLMDLDESIEEALPHLAASLPGCTYIHGTGVINVMDEGHIIAIYPRRLTITDVTNHDHAEQICADYFQRIQNVRGNIATIEPVFEKRSSLSVLDILRGLPKTNCGQCGSATCTAFAARVFRREESVLKCPPVAQNKTNHEKLLDQLQDNGYQI